MSFALKILGGKIKMYKEYIKTYEKWSLIGSILMFILAMSLIINPIGSINTFIIIFGIILIIDGIIHIIDYCRTEPEARIMSLGLVEGIFSIIAGVMIMITSNILIGIFPIMLSIWILVKSIFHFQNAINLKNIPESGWEWILIFSILTFILSLIIIFNPFSSTVIATRTLGIFVAISEIINILESVVTLIRLK